MATYNSSTTCPFRKPDPTVLMVESAQDVASDDAAAALNRSAIWGIFPPGESKSKDTRYLDLHEDDQLDEAQLAVWVKQASQSPGERM